ncbi:MAG: N-acetyltransferase [Planctomycetes bacterium]|nr:N-acetyltransferase [Planctomycetota bacterium]
MPTSVLPVRTAAERREFMMLPWRIYRDDPNWVAPLLGDLKKLLNPAVYPFFDHGAAEFFLARDGAVVRGRIAAIVNHLHNDTHHEKTGFFGFFECDDDPAIAAALFDAAAAWLRAQGMERMRGPASYSTNDECGLLIEGFDSPPVIMMSYNPAGYVKLVEGAGFVKAKDLLAYWVDVERIPERLARIADKVRERERVTVRSLDMRRFPEEVRAIQEIYNDAWAPNWGFVPMTDREFAFMAEQLKPVVVPDLGLIAEIDGKPVGFSLGLPDFNVALKPCRGRLFPFGIFKLLWHKRKIRHMRVITLGVRRAYQKKGIDAVFYVETMKRGKARDCARGEMSWILEDNAMMNRGAEAMGGRVYKRYRMYDRELAGR